MLDGSHTSTEKQQTTGSSDQAFKDGLAWHVTDYETLARSVCVMKNAEGILAELQEIYFAGKEGSLTKIEDLLKAIIDLYTA